MRILQWSLLKMLSPRRSILQVISKSLEGTHVVAMFGAIYLQQQQLEKLLKHKKVKFNYLWLCKAQFWKTPPENSKNWLNFKRRKHLVLNTMLHLLKRKQENKQSYNHHKTFQASKVDAIQALHNKIQHWAFVIESQVLYTITEKTLMYILWIKTTQKYSRSSNAKRKL